MMQPVCSRRGARLLLCLIVAVMLTPACAFPRSTPPTLKIGMIAPFEGLYRPQGYAALYAVKLAIRERNRAGGVVGYGIELVALNDDGEPTAAALQARKLAVDADVVGVVGPLTRATAEAAAGPLAEAGLAWVAPASVPDHVVRDQANAFRLFAADADLASALVGWAARQGSADLLLAIPEMGSFSAALNAAATAARIPVTTTVPVEGQAAVLLLGGDAAEAATILQGAQAFLKGGSIGGGPEAAGEAFWQRMRPFGVEMVWATSLRPRVWPSSLAQGYAELAGSELGPAAALAYDATQVLLDAVAQDIVAHGKPGRAGVAAALARVERDGLNGLIAFDAAGSWRGAPVELYRAVDGRLWEPTR